LDEQKIIKDRVTKILGWYDAHRRTLPWRSEPGVVPNPYHVWLSEIMLQQTTVATVKSYFEYFLTRWPKIENLAKAPLDDVLHAWQGLGYYARARNLHKCAQAISSDYDCRFPETESALLTLPGIGPYTASAIMAIAFNKKSTPMDGNIERVITRLYAVMEPLPKSKKYLYQLAIKMTPDLRAGDYAQALMDIGATICTPRSPNCGICPLTRNCVANLKGLEAELPKREKKPTKPLRRAIVFWVTRSSGKVLLRRRPERGLLGGMIEIPSSSWEVEKKSHKELIEQAPFDINWMIIPGSVRPTFTHFHLDLEILSGTYEGESLKGDIWSMPHQFSDHALPTVMKKVIAHIEAVSG
jgi:A/G-specific adenine glycosylase